MVRKYSSREKVIPDKPLPEQPEKNEQKDTLPAGAGLHRVAWNLRYEEPEFLGSTIFDMGRPDMPMALPGTYQVRLNVAGVSRTAPLEVKVDPRVKATPADLQKQFELAMQVRELFDRTHRALREIRGVRSQLQALKGRLGDPAKGRRRRGRGRRDRDAHVAAGAGADPGEGALLAGHVQLADPAQQQARLAVERRGQRRPCPDAAGARALRAS